jgi:NTP pyrophosphatase (non-canonical NTP hydrolase)
MTIEEYQEDAARTIRRGIGTCGLLIEGALGIASEAGEVVDVVKKFAFQGHALAGPEVEHLVEELGDVLWYMTEIMIASGVPMERVMQTNVKKRKRRYPEGFDAARSVARK